MEHCLPIEILTPFPQAQMPEVDRLWTAVCDANARKIVVLDDDPTGTQTVHGVSVYTDWTRESLRSGFDEPQRLFFVLTNSRSFTAAQTRAVHREIIHNILRVAQETGKPFLVVSRSDSTLRGHFPLETQLLREGLEQSGTTVDGEILCPYFAEGGCFTIDDVHYVRVGDQLVPAAQTEFAQDQTFGYKQSNLRNYVEEKTGGAFAASDVVSIAAADDYDLKIFCIALDRALAQGKQFCFRTAAAFVKALGGISSRPLLTRGEMIADCKGAGGIVVVGSHTQKTTAQLEALKLLPCVTPLALNSDLVLEPGALEAEATRITALCGELIRAGRTPAVYTNRTVLAVPSDTPEAALTRSVRISSAVQSIVEREVRAQLGASAEFLSLQDPSILADVREAGYVTTAPAARLVGLYLQAAQAGCDAVLNLCSSVGEVADSVQELAHYLGMPIVRVDDEMCREAVRSGSRIAVMATLPATLTPTKNTVQRVAREMNRRVTSVDCLVDGAFGLNPTQFRARLLESAAAIAGESDVILLAQGSMAYRETYLSEQLGKCVLSSPRFGAAALRAALAAKGCL